MGSIDSLGSVHIISLVRKHLDEPLEFKKIEKKNSNTIQFEEATDIEI